MARKISAHAGKAKGLHHPGPWISLEGITLDELCVETEGEFDFRGLFGLEPTVRAGCDQLRDTVRIRAGGTPEQLEKTHHTVMATSPNDSTSPAPSRCLRG